MVNKMTKHTIACAKTTISNKGSYGRLFSDVSGIVTRGRVVALRQIGTVQVITYWLVGRRIVEFCQKGEERAAYGKKLLYRLAVDLTTKHGRGFSERNLEIMRMFYLQYPISQTVSAKFKLSWSHYCELLKEDRLDARSFYEIEAIENGRSTRELRRQMDTLLFERLALSRDKKKVRALARKGQVVVQPEDAVKDPYILEFLGLKEETAYTESHLEQAVIDVLGNLNNKIFASKYRLALPTEKELGKTLQIR